LLYGKLLESDATRLSEALASLGIDYVVTANPSAVYVPKQKVCLARLELARKGIVASPAFTFDLLNAQSGPTSPANAGYLAALERELGSTLACLPGVNTARVLIQVPGNRGRINGDRAFAVVVVQTRGENKLSDEAVRTIQTLVSSTTDLVTAEQVAVTENLDSKALAEFNPNSL
jgi:flagellar biosynthesis/type III secretory pathway M-ring protein FliF/YscJ